MPLVKYDHFDDMNTSVSAKYSPNITDISDGLIQSFMPLSSFKTLLFIRLIQAKCWCAIYMFVSDESLVVSRNDDNGKNNYTATYNWITKFESNKVLYINWVMKNVAGSVYASAHR